MRTLVSAEVLFQMLLGMTSSTPTTPVHVTFPGLMGNFIRTFLICGESWRQPGGNTRSHKNAAFITLP